MIHHDPNNPARRKTLVGTIFLSLILGPVGASPVLAQLPGLPGGSKMADPPKPDPSKKPVAARDTPGTVFATTSWPIAVNKKVDDSAIQKTLLELHRQFPGVYEEEVSVDAIDGAVTLNGHVDDDDTVNDVTAFAEKVEGVRLVLNRMKTDAVAEGNNMLVDVKG